MEDITQNQCSAVNEQSCSASNLKLKFEEFLKEKSLIFKEWLKGDSPVRIISHFDADGICSAEIITKSLEKLNKFFHLSITNQLKDETFDKLKKEDYSIIIFSDLGSGQIEQIKKLNGNSKILIIDHHTPSEEQTPDNILHINPFLLGINGDESASCSSVVYKFMSNLTEIPELEHLALIGAIGDNQEKDTFTSINQDILTELLLSKKIIVKKDIKLFGKNILPSYTSLKYSTNPYIPSITGNESSSIQLLSDLGISIMTSNGEVKKLSNLSDEEKEKLTTAILIKRQDFSEDPMDIFGNVYLLDEGEQISLSERAFLINVCSRMGHIKEAFEICESKAPNLIKVQNLIDIYNSKIMQAIRLIEEGKITKFTKNSMYVLAKNQISDKLIGELVNILSMSETISLEKEIIIGFADVNESEVKISVKKSQKLKKINLKKLLPLIAKELGGKSGGHDLMSGAFIPAGKEEEFINRFEQLISE